MVRWSNFCVDFLLPLFSLGTEFVVVEDSSCLDTNAIILKGTTVLTYKPRFLDRPFSGSLAGIEVTVPSDAQINTFKSPFCFRMSYRSDHLYLHLLSTKPYFGL